MSAYALPSSPSPSPSPSASAQVPASAPAEGFTALSDPTRRTIFERVASGPQSVTALAAGLPVSRPAVSQHLRVLKDASLVKDQRDGNRRIYQLDPDGVQALRGYLDQFWNQALGAFKATVDQRETGEQMSTQSTIKPVQVSTIVDAPIERAFSVFTQDIGSWWPPDHHILEAELAEMVFEPRIGGHIYDRGVDGSECRWARVLAYEPPKRVVFSWDINLRWQLELDPERTSEVEVRFVSEGPERTRVELEHRGIERHGPGWENMRGAVASPGGWPAGLQAFAQRLAS